MPARSWRRLALRARRRWRGRSARPAPAASPISASRYAHGARRTALRAEGAARLCAGPPRAAQPLAAIDASRYALGADAVWALRARAGAYMCSKLAGTPTTARSERSGNTFWGPQCSERSGTARSTVCKLDHFTTASHLIKLVYHCKSSNQTSTRIAGAKGPVGAVGPAGCYMKGW